LRLDAEALVRTAASARSDPDVWQARPRPEAARRVLLLTSGLGSGHVRAAKAVEEAWRAADPQATLDTLDFWSLMDPGVADLIQQSYLRLVSEHPDLYDRVYHLDQRLWHSLLAGGAVPASLQRVLRLFSRDASRLRHGGKRIDRWLFLAVLGALKGRAGGWPGGVLRSGLLGLAYRCLARRLGTHVRALDPDVIVVTEMWPAVLLSPLKARRTVTAPVVGVLTDYGVHDLWVQPGLDHYCVGSADMAATLRAAGVEAARISVTGIPLMPGFRHPPSQEEARAALGLDPARAVVLLLGGGLGLGVEEAVKRMAISGTDAHWLVVAGRNQAALAHLSALAAASSRLQLYGWTEHMERLLRAADVVVGKSGGLTVAEAMACGRPLVATHCLRGQEGFNVRFLEAHGVGRLVPEQDLAATVAALLADRRQLAAMQERAWQLGHRDSAQRVVEAAVTLGGGARVITRAPRSRARNLTGGMRQIMQSGLHRVDDLYHRWHRLQPVGEVLYAGRARYRGPAREFADGTRLAPGDFVGTLHLNNARFPRIAADTAARAALVFARLMLESMRILAERARQDPAFADLAIYHAVSWLPPHGRGIGFITEPFPAGPRKRLMAAYFRLLVWAFAPAEQTRVSARPDPTVYWLTRKALLTRFGEVRDAP
jgi:UDP-N-acetylglucosamine:LPS N-acetylglucosamine transferase